MKNILVPTDFSKNADSALNYAIGLAKKEKAKILLLHAYHLPIIASDAPMDFANAAIEAEREESIARLKTLQQKVIKAGLRKCDFLAKPGFAVDAILATAKTKRNDLIIMGTKGASGIKAAIVGSNAAVIIEKADCPVIAVPEKASFSKIKEIVYATDYRINDLSSLKALIKIMKPFNPAITAVHVSGGDFIPQSEKELLKEFILKVGKKAKYRKLNYRVIYGKDIEKKLENYVAEKSADLLVMSTHHRNIFDKIFGSSITKKMAYHTKVPLLAFHYKKDPIIFT